MKQPRQIKTEERIFEPQGVSIETSKTEKQRKKDGEKKIQSRISKNYGTTTKDSTYAQWEYQKEKKKERSKRSI